MAYSALQYAGGILHYQSTLQCAGGILLCHSALQCAVTSCTITALCSVQWRPALSQRSAVCRGHPALSEHSAVCSGVLHYQSTLQCAVASCAVTVLYSGIPHWHSQPLLEGAL
eukprot:1149713-Pelagomonas_calceolata.AAC.7